MKESVLIILRLTLKECEYKESKKQHINLKTLIIIDFPFVYSVTTVKTNISLCSAQRGKKNKVIKKSHFETKLL